MTKLDSRFPVVLEALSRGASRASACQAAGISRSGFYRRLRAEPAWRARVEHAEALATGAIEHALWKAAAEGNLVAMIFFLTNRAPEDWKHGWVRRREPTGSRKA